MGRLIAFPAAGTSQPASAALYSTADVSRLARVPRHRLYDWRREGIVFPTISVRVGDEQDERYSFDALIYLRLIRMLREDADVPLPRAVEAVKALAERFGEPRNWSQARIFVHERNVYVDRADAWGVTVASKPGARRGQKAAVPLFDSAFAQLKERVDALLIPTRYQRYVEIDPAARDGMPIIVGTTIRTATIRALQLSGNKQTDIARHYPHLSPAQIRGALNFEAWLDAA